MLCNSFRQLCKCAVNYESFKNPNENCCFSSISETQNVQTKEKKIRIQLIFGTATLFPSNQHQLL